MERQEQGQEQGQGQEQEQGQQKELLKESEIAAATAATKQPINENSESFINFIRRYRNSPESKRIYTNWIRRYVEYSNLPQVKAKIGIDVGDNTDLLLFDDVRKTQNHVKRFLDYLYDTRHVTPRSVRFYYTAVKHFYQSNEITLNWTVIKDFVGSSRSTNVSANIDMPYTYEEIHKMLDKCDERKRVMVLLFASTGIRRGALPDLKVGDLKWIEQYRIYELTVYRGFAEQYITYCTSECAYSINSYLDFRRRKGEEITPNSYLIRKQFNTISKRKISDARDPPHKHKVNIQDIQSILYRLIYDAGVRNYNEIKTRLGDRHRNMAAHSFRKFFQNKCLESGIDPFYVEVLMGHKVGVSQHYYRPTAINGENSLLELYAKKAMPYLTISDEQRLKLKNQELELRLSEDNRRIQEAEQNIRKQLEQRDRRNDEMIQILNERLEEMSREMHQMRKEKFARLKERQSDINELLK